MTAEKAMDTITLTSARASERCVEDHGPEFTAHYHPFATVVRVNGDVDAYNVDRVSNYVGRVITAAEAVVLDLSRIDFLSVAGLRALLTFDEECARVGVSWVMVTSPAVDRTLKVAGGDLGLPAFRTMDAALLQLAGADDAPRTEHQVTPREVTRC